ncbi:MAG: hypothetical protein OQK54_08605 [Gammaproteobacteria bacterium]|nr:hypothetical protein [Gammaproteobacteria bacterium]
MKKRNLITTLALTAVMGTAMALPATASAHEVIKEKRVKVIKTSDRHHGDVDRWYVERHREVTRWAPPRHGHKHRKHRGHDRGHHYGHRKQRHEYREYRRVEHEPVYRQRDRDGMRVRIDYDFWL